MSLKGLFGGGSSASAPVPVVTPAASVPTTPTPADPSVALAGANMRGGAPYGGTVANVGGQPGLTKRASTAQKTLLGD